ncbi:hypothetical protein T06_2535 [Trichinella sp. T6]|nr:hypothetical protein T06_2535 [Trichinella sp. T6]
MQSSLDYNFFNDKEELIQYSEICIWNISDLKEMKNYYFTSRKFHSISSTCGVQNSGLGWIQNKDKVERLSSSFYATVLIRIISRVIEVIRTSSAQFRGRINREKAGYSHNGNNTNNTAQFKEALLLLI